MLCIDFPIQTGRTYFSSSEVNATAASPLSFRNRAMHSCALFLQTRNWNVSQLRAITPITIGREKTNERTGEKRRLVWFLPASAYFRYKFSRKCNGSDLQRTGPGGSYDPLPIANAGMACKSTQTEHNSVDSNLARFAPPIDAVISSHKPMPQSVRLSLQFSRSRNLPIYARTACAKEEKWTSIDILLCSKNSNRL